MQLTLFDVIVIAIVAISALAALARGAVAEILGLVSWLGAAIVAFLAMPHVAPLVRPVVAGEGLADALALAGTFVVALILLKLVTGMVAGAVSGTALSPVDKVLGLAFGAARGVILVCAAYLLGSHLVKPEAQPDWVQQAYLITPVRTGAGRLESLLPESYRQGGLDRANPKPDGETAGKGYSVRERQAMDRLVAPNP